MSVRECGREREGVGERELVCESVCGREWEKECGRERVSVGEIE